MNTILRDFEKVFGKNKVKLNEPMSIHTTFKVGGPAEYYIEIDKIDDLVKIISTVNKFEVPFFILGGGSNILVSDAGIKGMVIKNNCRKFGLRQMGGRIKNGTIKLDKVFLYAESGCLMNQLVRFTVDKGLQGLECLLGLPGTVGGAIFMNSNFPKEDIFVGDYLEKAKIATKEGEIKEVGKSYFMFDYDRSALQESKEIVLSVVFRLKTDDKEKLWTKATEALKHREITYPEKPSAGCIFRNITKTQAFKIRTPDGITSAGFLIDKVGLKGKRIGDAIISKRHANFILNLGNAKASDIVELMNLMEKEVYGNFGVKLESEIELIGFN